MRTLRLFVIAYFIVASAYVQASNQDENQSDAGNAKSIAEFDFEGLDDGTEPEDWLRKGSDEFVAKTATESAAGGDSCLKIVSTVKGAEKRPVGALNYLVEPNKCNGRRVRFRASVKAEFVDDGKITMWLREDLKSGGNGAFENGLNKPIKNGDWKEYEVVAELTDEVKQLTVGFLMFGEGKVLVDDIVVEIVDDSISETVASNATDSSRAAPGLFQIKGSMQVRASENAGQSKVNDLRVLMPLPLVYRSQFPLTYNLKTNPASALKSVRIFEDKPMNFVAELILSDVAKLGDVDVEFESVVLVAPTSFRGVPESVDVPDTWPDEAKQWLASTWCVNSKHPRIKSMANRIRNETDDVMEIIKQVEKRARRIFESAEGQVENLTAVEALDKKGSCTSCGNLVAAMLRASDVPARVLAGYPSWSGPLQTHYIVEAYVPEFGWYPIESTKCRSPWPNQNQINVSIVPTEYESKSLAGYRTGVAGGVPYLSLTEITNNDGNFFTIGTIPEHDYCDHECKFIRPFQANENDWEAATKLAKDRWGNWLGAKTEVKRGKVRFGPMTEDIKADTIEELLKEVAR